MYGLTIEDVHKAHERIKSHIHKTPVMTNKQLDERVGRNVFIKCEHLQKTGSFKPRGMLNSIFLLKEEGTCKGVVTHSSGNAGMGLAWSSRAAGFPCTVVTPKDSPKIKADAIKGYGAEVVLCEPNPQARMAAATKVAEEKKYTLVHSYDRPTVIAGQGTMAVEFLEQVPQLDAIFTSAGGGGMLAGVAFAAKQIKPSIKIYVVEPKGKDLGKCMKAKERLWPNPPQFVTTIADGVRNQQLGQLNWPIVRDMVEPDVFTMTDDDIKEAMRYVWTRTKQIIETSAAITFAGVMSEHMKKLPASIKNVGVVSCGGNVDLDKLPWVVGSYYA